MTRADAAWLTFWAGFGLLDYAADRRGVSMCTSVRRLARLDTPAGRRRFHPAYAVGALVLWKHLAKRT